MEWWQIQELMWSATGIIVVLVAVLGVTLRLAIKPFIADLGKLKGAREGKDLPDAPSRLDRIEEQLETLGSSVERLADAVDFDRRLGAGGGGGGQGTPE